MKTFSLHKDELAKTIPHKEEIFDFILYDRDLGNAVTSNEIIYKI